MTPQDCDAVRPCDKIRRREAGGPSRGPDSQRKPHILLALQRKGAPFLFQAICPEVEEGRKEISPPSRWFSFLFFPISATKYSIQTERKNRAPTNAASAIGTRGAPGAARSTSMAENRKTQNARASSPSCGPGDDVFTALLQCFHLSFLSGIDSPHLCSPAQEQKGLLRIPPGFPGNNKRSAFSRAVGCVSSTTTISEAATKWIAFLLFFSARKQSLFLYNCSCTAFTLCWLLLSPSYH